MSIEQEILNALEKAAVAAAISYVKANAAKIEAELAPFISDGEAAVLAEVNKISPELGALVQAAFTSAGPEISKYEGDAVAWVESVLAAYEKSL